jgi:hypothetical protein
MFGERPIESKHGEGVVGFTGIRHG